MGKRKSIADTAADNRKSAKTAKTAKPSKSTVRTEKNPAGGSVRRKIILCLISIGINVAGLYAMTRLGIPLYLDTVGTVLASALGGGLPGVFVGFVTNIINGVMGTQSVYYGIVNMAVAVISAFFARKAFFRDTVKPLLLLPVYSLICGPMSAVLTWFLNGGHIGGIGERFALALCENAGLEEFPSQLAIDFIIECIDKAIVLVAVIMILRFLPSRLLERFYEDRRRHDAELEGAKDDQSFKCRIVSLRVKLMAILVAAAMLIAGVSAFISYELFQQSTIERYQTIAEGAAQLADDAIDYDKVYRYMTNGEEEPGYTSTEKKLYRIRDSLPDIEYLYVYRILEDGCHVVFDLDTEDLPGSEPGEVIPFEDAFMSRVPALLAGEKIDPIISKDTYGWLLTVYHPLYDDTGKCRCYVAVDVSMQLLAEFSFSFLAKLLSLFASFLVLTVFVSRWIIQRSIVKPINSMARCASAFAYNTTAARSQSVEALKALDIKTGDEVENLYQAFISTTEESMRYVAESKRKSHMIAEMQKGLIVVLADLVESRDKCTGDHVRKTAAYVEIIVNEMKKRGFYADQMTPEFMQNVIDSAPLHDVGKIHIPDQILNKPGKLTDEEFAIMKTHTSVGREIIDRVIEMVPDSGYLKEARNLAEYHHEKWNGRGYPHGLSAEDIPLSARIMAVADVFDALVSRRSYKKPFTFEKAMSIIREDAGTHFDPLVAEAFIGASDQVRKVAEEFDAMNGSFANLGSSAAPAQTVPAQTTTSTSAQTATAQTTASVQTTTSQPAQKTQISQAAQAAQNAIAQAALARQAAAAAQQEEMMQQAAAEIKRQEMARQAAAEAQKKEAARQAAVTARQKSMAQQAAEQLQKEQAARQAAEKARQEEAARQAAEKARQEEAARQAAAKQTATGERRGLPTSHQHAAKDTSIASIAHTHDDQVIFTRKRHKN